MKILFYGAGVLGSLYAARLQKAGNEVSILARKKRLIELRKHGIVLKDKTTALQTTTQVNVVEQLALEDAYDLVVVLMRKNQIASILPFLKANNHTPNVLFMNNNAAGADEWVNALGKERVILGFPGAGGELQGHIVHFSLPPKIVQPTTFGELDGRTTERLTQISQKFKAAGFPTAINSNMDAWLKCHVAWVSPLANAIYMSNGDNYQLAQNRDSVQLVIHAIREGFKVLQSLGMPITPFVVKMFFKWIPMPILTIILQAMFNTKKCEIMMTRHVNAARDEMKQLADEFRELIRTTSIATPAIDQLYQYVEPNQSQNSKDSN